MTDEAKAELVSVNHGQASNRESLMQQALDKNVPVETLEKLVGLYERVTDRAAAAEFAAALASFQAKCPAIPKKSVAKIATRGGAGYEYRYADLDQIATHIRPLLSQHEFSYSWDSSVKDGSLECTCTLRHSAGHFAVASFSCPVQSSSAMSEQQKHASALSYARRQSLVQVLGLTTTELDDDGAGSTDTITADQQQTINAAIANLEMTAISKRKFLALLSVKTVEDIRAVDFRTAMNMITAKARASQ